MGKAAVSSARNASAESAGRTLRPDNSRNAASPMYGPTGGRKFAGYERMGAAYGITARFGVATAPEAGMTQASGRLFKSVINRTRPNFDDGIQFSQSR
jgi:hypothetical protein